jgi:leucyl-tRNA synthetase
MEPIVPHICWEISNTLFGGRNLGTQRVCEEVFEVESLTLGVSVNGKNRASIEVGVQESESDVVEIAKASVEKWLEGKEIVKSIVIPGKLVNLVLKG